MRESGEHIVGAGAGGEGGSSTPVTGHRSTRAPGAGLAALPDDLPLTTEQGIGVREFGEDIIGTSAGARFTHACRSAHAPSRAAAPYAEIQPLTPEHNTVAREFGSNTGAASRVAGPYVGFTG